MGQLHAQLPAAQPSDSKWGEDLHDPVSLPGGTEPHRSPDEAEVAHSSWWNLLSLITDGELHAASSHNQRHLHGVLLSGHKAVSFPIYSQPFWYRKPEGGRRVRFKSHTKKYQISSSFLIKKLIVYCLVLYQKPCNWCLWSQSVSPGWYRKSR